ncbi:MAG: lysylphosphatidylglycerol synthase domain-containing protein [Alphaproteobacteria bacterium]
MPLVARLKRWLTPAGWALAVLALGLVGYRLMTGGGVDLLLERPRAWWTVVPAIPAYALASVAVTAAWWALLKPFERRGLTFPSAHRIYALSQIGKYLPGNVMHFVGRAAMARAEGTPVTRTGVTMVQEGVLMMTASLGLAAALGGTQWLGISPALSVPAVILMALMALAISSAPEIARRAGLGRTGDGDRRAPGHWRLAWAASALAGYVLFFCASGVIFQWILTSLNAQVPFGLTLAAVCAGWLAGFVTPGASAGIGVREAVLITALGSTAGPAAAPAALMFRLVTTGGDILLFASGAALRRPALHRLRSLVLQRLPSRFSVR